MTDIVYEPLFENKTNIFRDRFHAGELLAEKLEEYRDGTDVYILAIPAGGVQVAIPIYSLLYDLI